MEHDPWVTCPYDKVHRVPLSRIQGHIIKCEKHYPKLSICPYNATHRMPEDDMKKHLINCESRRAMYPVKPPERSHRPPSPHGAIHKPRPMLQKEYLPETDPNHEMWD